MCILIKSVKLLKIFEAPPYNFDCDLLIIKKKGLLVVADWVLTLERCRQSLIYDIYNCQGIHGMTLF